MKHHTLQVPGWSVRNRISIYQVFHHSEGMKAWRYMIEHQRQYPNVRPVWVEYTEGSFHEYVTHDHD